MTTPDWLQDAVFYQIFPDRFSNGNSFNDPANLAPWGAEPTIWNFMGGDLRGILQHFDYLLDLGVNALYLNPIFLSPSNHRYNTTDYYTIDPKLGTLTDFRALLDLAHRNHVRVVLDGVFNHCSRGFFAFSDLLENEEHSPYKDWFHVHRYPLDAYTPGDALHYEAWWKFKSLPKFNTNHPAVRKYILDVARYWIDFGADGWRLDVPNEINDDAFWADFRQVVKSANPEACLIGEIWTADPRWANETHFDGLMHYPVRDALLPCFNGKENVTQFADKVEGLFNVYPRENLFSMYLTLGTHDTERILTMLGGNLDKLKLAFQFLFAYPGAPAIYYGDEVGLEGGKDPDCRRAFPWDSADWKADLRPWFQNLIAARKERASLRRGGYTRLMVDETHGLYAFVRSLGQEKTLVVLNLSDQAANLRLPVRPHWQTGQTLQNLLDHQSVTVSSGKLHLNLPAWSGLYLG